MSRGRVLLLGFSVLLGATIVPHAWAIESEGFTITDENMHQMKEFGPIPGQNPGPQVADMTLANCKTLPSSNAVSIRWEIESTNPTKAQVNVTWPAAEANDLDLYFFDEAGNLLASSASADPQESINLGGVENGTYWACVNNFSGANAGFTLDVQAEFLQLYERPPETPTPVARRTAEPTAAPTDAALTEPTAPPPSPEVIATPGPDGTSDPRDLLAISGRRQATPSGDSPSGLAIGLLALTGLVAVSGVGMVALRIRRDTRSAS